MSDSTTKRLTARIRAVWRRERLLCLVGGALMLLKWGVGLFLAGALIDWLTHMPSPGRAVILLVVLAGALYKAWQGGWRHLRPFDATRTALQVEESSGGMKSLLVSAIQLQDAAKRRGTSDALCDLTCRNAEESSSDIRPKDTVRFQVLRRPAASALLVALIVGILSVTHGPLLVAGVGRIFAPWLAVTYPTRTRLELLDGDQVVQEGKSVRIAARVSGVVPRKAKIALRTGKGKPRVRKLRIVNGECEYPIASAFRGFEYRLSAGDARTPWHTVEVINAPNIDHAEVKLEFPAYTKRVTETVEALTLTVPETTEVEWTLTLDRAVREASLNLAGQDPEPIEISEDGLTVSFDQLATESRAYGFSWVERDHGFAFTSPSHYLQVSPDRPPRVELTSPPRNLYATLGRKLDLAFRGRDDHGISKSVVSYRVDKTEEERVEFTPAGAIDGTEQTIDWDYRNVLTNLAVGQSVTFVVELSDSYPGEKGPHVARSGGRRIQFMSRAQYLAQIEKQKKRLLSRLRTIYREEREVHEVVMRLSPSDPVFVQTCQLEAVRQDLMRDRINKLAGRMHDLTEDLAANSITNKVLTDSLADLRSDLLAIATTNVSAAADSLRALASESTGRGNGESAKAEAADTVNTAARELGLLVLHLGFQDAADVMAREMHAAAQTQAALRLRTITPGGETAELADAQARLGKWLTRLFAASPKDKESSIEDALIEFTLTRIVKQMVEGGIDTRLEEAGALIGDGKTAQAAKEQADVIAALLKGEFRLRVGAEREALAKAMELFLLQQEEQRELRLEIEGLDDAAFKERRTELARRQAASHRNLQLLLMPGVPAPRVRLFDDVFPDAPPVAELLGAADVAMTEAEARIKDGGRGAAVKSLAEAEAAFARLIDIGTRRVAAMSQAVRIDRLSYASQETDEILSRFGERQLSLLEKTEDAAADDTKSDYLADQEAVLADALEELKIDMESKIKRAATPSEHSLSLPTRLDGALQSMRKAVPLLRGNRPDEAAPLQEAAIASLAGGQELLAEHGSNIAPFAGMLAMTRAAVAPSPYVQEIEEEQRDMLELTRESKPDDMPKLALPQRNLVHAVDAILVALDPVAHLVESGTVMLFAKDDMDAAGEALEIKDDVEALDAQDYIVETLGELRSKIDAVVPQYRYLLELTEALHETVQEGIRIREQQRVLRERTMAEADGAPALAKAQGELRTRTDAYGKLIEEIAGLGLVESSLVHMAGAEELLNGADAEAAAARMQQAEAAMRADTGTLLTLMTHLSLVLAAPPPATEIPQEIVLLQEVLAVAAKQKHTYRESGAAPPGDFKAYESGLREFEKACDPFIARAEQHKNPVIQLPVKVGEPAPEPKPVPPANLHLRLVAAKGHLGKAAAAAGASERTASRQSQKLAAEALRHFVAEYALKFVKVPGPPPPADPAPTDDFNESEDIMMLFMPGAVSGKRPPDGKLEWDVLGKRDRAALNENFARELPLEYRAILKDYYERLAR